MATSKAASKAKARERDRQRAITVMGIAYSLMLERTINCQALFALQETTQQLLIEGNCLPLAQPQPMKQAKKVAVKKKSK
jgi:hypothetical protein